VIAPDAAWLLVDSRYDERARREAPDVLVLRTEGRPGDTMRRCLEELGASKVGFEADTVSVSELDRLRRVWPDLEWVATSGLVERLRAAKSEAEIELIRAAAELTDRAMAYAYENARAGMTEKALAWALEVFMRENGAEALAFDIIVASGPNGALPHHQSSDRPLAPGEPIVIDLGARLNGYCGDLTRTFCLGSALDADYASVYGLVDHANRLAISSVRPGMTGTAADAVARGAIAAAGYGEMFGHGLGHGVGLYIHELPRLGPMAEEEPLVSGMVVTIEPGVYLPGRVGVRIEDLVVVRDDSADVLSRAAKQPEIPSRR
jgi:Xaa-Pro aminopeptidase